MRLLACILVRLPDLDGLVRFARDETQAGLVEGRAHDAGLCVEGAGLGDGLGGLEAVARLPVPEGDGAVVAAGEEDVVFVDGEGVDDGVVAGEALHEGAFGTLELLDGLRRGASERELAGVQGECANGLFVMRQHRHGLGRGQIYVCGQEMSPVRRWGATYHRDGWWSPSIPT